MAISKTQNERPAIIDLIDTVNAMGDVRGQFATLTQSLGATNQQILLLTQDVDALEAAQPAINNLLQRIKIGETETVTVPANDSYASSYVFPQPFTDGDGCIILLQVITGELSTLFEVTLIDCTYSGFSYQISNSDADAHDVKLGYVAFKTNGN